MPSKSLKILVLRAPILKQMSLVFRLRILYVYQMFFFVRNLMMTATVIDHLDSK